MLQNPCKTLGFKKNMVYKIPPGGEGGKPYPASGLFSICNLIKNEGFFSVLHYLDLDTRKPVVCVCDQVRLTPACSATETS